MKNRLFNNKNQISLQYGLKYIIDSIDNEEYKGITHLLALDTQLALNKNWNLGLHGAILKSPKPSKSNYSLGSYIGYNGRKFTDIKAGLVYETHIGLGARIGYRIENLTIDDIDDTNTNIDIKGIYAGLFFHF